MEEAPPVPTHVLDRLFPWVGQVNC